MFTGLIERVGSLIDLKRNAGAGEITIAHDPWGSPLAYGESVAVNGACLTVARCSAERFTCDVLGETLARTNLGELAAGAPVNLERALPATGRFGGHIVQGHVDGVGALVAREPLGRDWLLRVRCADKLTAEMVLKGSVTLNGVSLTLTAVSATEFEVNVIPVTCSGTNLGALTVGAPINVETDILAKYVRKLSAQAESELGMEDLRRAGFC